MIWNVQICSYNVGPPVISWCIIPMNTILIGCYGYHKPKLWELYTNLAIVWGLHIVPLYAHHLSCWLVVVAIPHIIWVSSQSLQNQAEIHPFFRNQQFGMLNGSHVAKIGESTHWKNGSLADCNHTAQLGYWGAVTAMSHAVGMPSRYKKAIRIQNVVNPMPQAYH